MRRRGGIGRRARQKRTKHVCRSAPTAVSILKPPCSWDWDLAERTKNHSPDCQKLRVLWRQLLPPSLPQKADRLSRGGQMSCYFASLRRAALENAPQPCLQSGFCPPLEGDRSAGPGGGQGASSTSAAHGGGVDRELSAPDIGREEKTTGSHTRPARPSRTVDTTQHQIAKKTSSKFAFHDTWAIFEGLVSGDSLSTG